MDRSHGHAAELLRRGASGYAVRAVEMLLDRCPETAVSYGGRAFQRWKDNLTLRVNELAASVEFAEPEMFVSDIRWQRIAFESREVPIEHLERSLECLSDALLELLPEEAFEATERTIALAQAACTDPVPAQERLSIGAPYGELALSFLERSLEGDRLSAVSSLVTALNGGVPLDDLYEHVLLACEREIGTMWHLSEATVSEEHVVTETTRTAIGVLSFLTVEHHIADEGRPTVLLSAVEGEEHDLPLRCLGDLLEVTGHRAICLGRSTPIEEIAQAVEGFNVDVVVLSATMTTFVPAVARTIERVREYRPGVKVLVGGGAFAIADGLHERVGADGYAGPLRDAVQTIRGWLDSE